jgi:hypothetical protein
MPLAMDNRIFVFHRQEGGVGRRSQARKIFSFCSFAPFNAMITCLYLRSEYTSPLPISLRL